MVEAPDPKIVTETLAAFVDVLIPGDDDFPSASSAGTQGLVANRIRERLGGDAFGRIVQSLNQSAPFASASRSEQTAIVERFAEEERDLFVFLRFATYFSYYELPAVISTLQRIGHDYNDAPQPLGYTLPPFDPSIHLPANPRGSYKQTGEITRIDLTTLAELNLPVQGV